MTNPENWVPLPLIPKKDYRIVKDPSMPLKKRWQEWMIKNNLGQWLPEKTGLTITEQRFNHFL
ncbi:hypothetical protein [Sediminibacterium goheungense]|uniref:Uncharacterized protein n=1 Tax=Sediminibacterium goheungense TaxID=1086393 RepID=A0A4R6IUT7_9BACT|nr:hypothetical protein [Sediminibacterium goheungense]TDO25706.1 hypothetical protein BC659_2629 [Sediminibacterium goheungense]